MMSHEWLCYLNLSFQQTVSTVTSLEVCVDSVCYATMSRDLQVTEWSHVDLTGSNQQKQTPAQILEQVKKHA